jgi:hypothetical protein
MSTGTIHKARSIFYIIIISGLLSLTSFVIMLVWNNSLSFHLDMEEISFLEAVGLVAFVYVVYFGIKFGEAKCNNDSKEVNLSDTTDISDKMSYADEMIAKDLLKNVPENEREDLKDFIARCCGFQDIPKTKQNAIQKTIHINND